MHYLATDQKNKIFLLLSQQQLTVFNPQKNHRFSTQTRRFVQRVGGLCFLKQIKMNTKLLKNQVEFVCHGQALLGRASIPFSSGHWPGLLLNNQIMKKSVLIREIRG